MYNYPVCPIQGRQLLDVDPADLFGDFRICKTYKSGGGYDQFPAIAYKRGLITSALRGDIRKQFVVQLYGCNLRCPYCYVTRDGIQGLHKIYTNIQLLEAFSRAYKEHDVGVFHLMGGAPALYIHKWLPLAKGLFPHYLFHSDLLLTEMEYELDELKQLALPNALYAVNIKGTDNNNYELNTGTPANWPLLFSNLEKVIESGMNFYITFTNPDPVSITAFKMLIEETDGKEVLEDSFIIDLKQYDALKDGPAW